MTVAAVIPHWNRRVLLAELLDSLGRQRRRFERVIVVDNGSTDGSAEVAEKGGAELLRLDRNYGFAAAVNRGIEAARGAEWIAILNNDVRLDPAWLEHLLESAGGAAFATGKIVSARDPRRLDGAWDEISRGACPVRCGAGAWDGPRWNRRREIRMASMTAAVFRARLFEEVGPLDERFVSYLEDVDFGIRCARRGHTGVYEPQAVAWHAGSATWGRWNPDTVRLLARNQVLLTRKHFAGQPRWPILAGQWLWGGVALRHGCGRAWWRGRRAGWREAVTSEAGDPAAFSRWLRAGEREIRAVQAEMGWELYWRLYAWLVPLR
jgi:GT2 family glycosyltransferase